MVGKQEPNARGNAGIFVGIVIPALRPRVVARVRQPTDPAGIQRKIDSGSEAGITCSRGYARGENMRFSMNQIYYP
ncbi:hypothetical protein A2524_04120 [Candidatus Wolfebacteria bacterium RIFOXYD12_FULL_48_21]|uniref:Uncharacterized protein n=1 Tax=Candidatus Wolfebacteria bacterium RIFOXYD1_FULL_48_65 TaxID=1802561 RepID=A0A1F8E1L9_9BACT|nr:MAG: hypothetical protein A2610_01755 [Candidatus Wolfebacteria bacterium RIFOXYD1_FULL_48_65]OGM95370.1 MAG: hypothetical protein A2524_04120 [Candidatus Wolfebacteria bacterium RIFOXYD12_FULL_48_21]OGM96845.1 MAG: hypothetical protein A2532_01670 [Candidatus Wolfebacteria bacterium RIFOXYD2_FULL_48_11]